MKSLALADSQRPEIQGLAAQLPSPTLVDQFLRAHWVIIDDPIEAELIRGPYMQVTQGLFAGDCDDAATLACSLLAANGIPCSLVAIKTVRDLEFSHVYARSLGLDIDPIVPVSQIPIPGIAETMTVQVL